LLYLIN